MANHYLVLDRNEATTQERYLFVRDGFAFWALLFALPWLLIKRLWLEACLLALAYVAFGLLALSGEFVWLMAFYVFNTVAAIWVALDGQHWLVEKHLRQGWVLKTVVEANSRDDAELMFALDPSHDEPLQPSHVKTRAVRLGRPSRSGDMLFATPWGNE